MKKEQAHGTSSTANVVEQRGTIGNKLTILREPAVQVLHKWELTTTTALVFGLMSSFPVSAAELVLKPTLTISKPVLLEIEINQQHDILGMEFTAEASPAEGRRTTKVAAITFLPDWMGEGNTGEIGIDINIDSKWCEDNGYLLTCPSNMSKVPNKDCPRDHNYGTCSLEQFCKDNDYLETPESCKKKGGNYYVDKNQKCSNGQELYKNCIINNQQGCKDAGFVNSCSSGRLYKSSNHCPYDNSYGKCCTASPSTGCPSNYEVGCSGSVSGADACGYECKLCDPCPNYYKCDGNWQYCTGSTCSDGSKRCSKYCESDHFPYSCGSDYGPCYGDYRNGYCSTECSYYGSSDDSSSSSCSNSYQVRLACDNGQDILYRMACEPDETCTPSYHGYQSWSECSGGGWVYDVCN